MSKTKHIAAVVAFVTLAVAFDVTCRAWGIPLVFGDIILLLISTILMYIFLSKDFLSGNAIQRKHTPYSTVIKKILGAILGGLLLLTGVFLMNLGLAEPLRLFQGVRGYGHGYSVGYLGLSVFLVTSAFFMY